MNMGFFKEAIEGISEMFFTPTSNSEHKEKAEIQPIEDEKTHPFPVKLLAVLFVIATSVILALIY